MIAAIVGSAVGALYSDASLPTRWRDNLLGRTAKADDGYGFELLNQTEALLTRFEIADPPTLIRPFVLANRGNRRHGARTSG